MSINPFSQRSFRIALLSLIAVLAVSCALGYFYVLGAVEAHLTEVIPAEVKRRVMGSLAGTFFRANVGIALVMVISLVIALIYLYRRIVRPLDEMVATLNQIAEGTGDLSREVDLQHTDLGLLGHSFNGFVGNMRTTFGSVRKMGVQIAREAVQVKQRIDKTGESARKQGEITDMVFTSSQETTKAIEQVSRSTQIISDSTNTNLESARSSLSEMQEIAAKINFVSEKASRFNQTVDDLSSRSNSINKIAALIRDVADNINLLALNAAIEAARAGEAGRGFAVVADEVRKLAESTQKASTEISENVKTILVLVENTRLENAEISTGVHQTREVVGRASSNFQEMVVNFENTGTRLMDIASALEQLSVTNTHVHDQINQINQISTDVKKHMTESEGMTTGLTLVTEGIQELVSCMKLGDGLFDRVIERIRLARDDIQEQLTQMHAAGVNIFDKNYLPFGNSTPPKFKVSWGDEFTRRCQTMLDSCMDDTGAAYTTANNTDGYISAHNLKFSKPLTGDPAVDLVGNRTCRIFNNPGELRAARNTNPILVRTYIRDTGELLCDIAMPMVVGGTLWGNLRCGIAADNLIRSS